MAKKIAILLEKMYEDLELHYPRLRLQEAGHDVTVIAPKTDTSYAGKHGLEQKADRAAKDCHAKDFDALVVPGGFSPDHMRRDRDMLRLVKEFADSGKPIAAICHGPWMLCSADAVRGRRVTSFYSLTDDMKQAGGKWVDEACVVDGPIITSRNPKDLPAFCKTLLAYLAEGHAEGVKGEPASPEWVSKR